MLGIRKKGEHDIREKREKYAEQLSEGIAAICKHVRVLPHPLTQDRGAWSWAEDVVNEGKALAEVAARAAARGAEDV